MQDFPKNQPACSVFEEYFYFLKRQPLNPTKQGSKIHSAGYQIKVLIQEVSKCWSELYFFFDKLFLRFLYCSSRWDDI